MLGKHYLIYNSVFVVHFVTKFVYYYELLGEGGINIFKLSQWPFSRGIPKNINKLITQKLLKKYSIFRTMTLL